MDYNFGVMFQVFLPPTKAMVHTNWFVASAIRFQIFYQFTNSKYIISKLKSLKETSYQTSQKVSKQIAIKHYLHGWIYNQNVNCLLKHLISKIWTNLFQIASVV